MKILKSILPVLPFLLALWQCSTDTYDRTFEIVDITTDTIIVDEGVVQMVIADTTLEVEAFGYRCTDGFFDTDFYLVSTVDLVSIANELWTPVADDFILFWEQEGDSILQSAILVFLEQPDGSIVPAQSLPTGFGGFINPEIRIEPISETAFQGSFRADFFLATEEGDPVGIIEGEFAVPSVNDCDALPDIEADDLYLDPEGPFIGSTSFTFITDQSTVEIEQTAFLYCQLDETDEYPCFYVSPTQGFNPASYNPLSDYVSRPDGQYLITFCITSDDYSGTATGNVYLNVDDDVAVVVDENGSPDIPIHYLINEYGEFSAVFAGKVRRLGTTTDLFELEGGFVIQADIECN